VVTASVALCVRCQTGLTAPVLPDHLWTGHVGPLLLLAQLSTAATCPHAAYREHCCCHRVRALCRCPLFRVPLRPSSTRPRPSTASCPGQGLAKPRFPFSSATLTTGASPSIRRGGGSSADFHVSMVPPSCRLAIRPRTAMIDVRLSANFGVARRRAHKAASA
jgi:hypothetical protein